MKNYGIKDLIMLINQDSDDYDEKYIKIKFNSDDMLPLCYLMNLYVNYK